MNYNYKNILIYIEKKLKKYNLDKEQKARFYDQAVEVVEACSNEFGTIEEIDQLVEEIFELNGVSPSLKKEKGILRVLIGLELICIALIIIFSGVELRFFDLLAIFFLNIGLINLFKKNVIATMVFLILFVLSLNSRIGILSDINFFNIIIALIILMVGMKLVFRNDKIKLKHQTYKHIHHTKMREEMQENFYKSYIESVDNEAGMGEIKRDIMFIKNIFGGSNTSLADERIKHILVENIFGGVEIDFKDFDFNSGAVTVDCHNSCGGITIIVNKKTEVIVMNHNILGGTSNDRTHDKENIEHTVYIKGKNVIGGIGVEYR